MAFPIDRFRRSTRLSFLGICALALTAGAAGSQEVFPSKPVDVVMHAGIGGGADIVTRMMTMKTRGELGTEMVVVQKTGGAGAAALEYVSTKPADGYTVFTFFPGHIIAILQGKSPLKREDIVPLARGNVEPNVLFVRADSPFQTIEDLVAAGKERKLTFGGTAVGAIDHLGVIHFANRAGLQQPNYIPHKGGGQAITSLITGDVEVAIGNLSETPQVETGEVRAIVVLSDKRLDAIPEVPTTVERGIDAQSEVVRGWAVRAGTPEERIAKLESAMLKGMNDPVYLNYLQSSGISPEGVAGREQFSKDVDELFETYEETLSAIGLL